MAKAPPALYPTMDVAAASFAAHRMNGGLYKQSKIFDNETNQIIEVITNKTRIIDHITGKTQLVISDQDREAASAAREFLVDFRTMVTLQERRVGDFINALVDRFNKPELETKDIGVMAYLPDVYSKTLIRSDRDSKVQMLTYTSQHFGSIGERVSFTLNVIDVKYVHKFSCYYVFGHDNLNNCIGYFTAKDVCTFSGNYTGKVKAHIVDNYRNNARVTQLNYVKAD